MFYRDHSNINVAGSEAEVPVLDNGLSIPAVTGISPLPTRIPVKRRIGFENYPPSKRFRNNNSSTLASSPAVHFSAPNSPYSTRLNSRLSSLISNSSSEAISSSLSAVPTSSFSGLSLEHQSSYSTLAR